MDFSRCVIYREADLPQHIQANQRVDRDSERSLEETQILDEDGEIVPSKRSDSYTRRSCHSGMHSSICDCDDGGFLV